MFSELGVSGGGGASTIDDQCALLHSELVGVVRGMDVNLVSPAIRMAEAL